MCYQVHVQVATACALKAACVRARNFGLVVNCISALNHQYAPDEACKAVDELADQVLGSRNWGYFWSVCSWLIRMQRISILITVVIWRVYTSKGCCVSGLLVVSFRRSPCCARCTKWLVVWMCWCMRSLRGVWCMLWLAPGVWCNALACLKSGA